MIEILNNNKRLAIIIVIIVVLIAINIVFLMRWQSAEDERSAVETEKRVADVNLTQARVQYDLNDLRSREAELSRNPDFPTDLPVVGLSLFFAGGAEQAKVSLDEVIPPTVVGKQRIGNRDYPAYATDVTVTGTMNQIISFVQYIEGGAFSSIRVQDVNLAGAGMVWEARLTVVVISQA